MVLSKPAIAAITLSDQGAHFIGNFEGYRQHPYQDGGGLWTVGYGHLIKDIAAFNQLYPDGVNYTQAATLMKMDVASTIQGLLGLKLDLPLQHHQDAVISLVFNIGISAFRKSIIFAHLEAKGTDLWPWEAWVKDAKGVTEGGLIRRRAAEMRLFIWGLYSASS